MLYGGSKDTIGCGVNLPQNENVRVWNNVFDSIYRHPTDNGTSYQTSNVIAEAANAQPGDVVADPQFVDRVAYELQATSPAANLGVTVAGTPADDLDGTPRGLPPDSGALEIETATLPAPDSPTGSVPETTLAPTTTDVPTTDVPTDDGGPDDGGPDDQLVLERRRRGRRRPARRWVHCAPRHCSAAASRRLSAGRGGDVVSAATPEAHSAVSAERR